MHVCRLWRMIAGDTPTLWSKPNLSWPKLAWEMISYSRSVPLEIEWSPQHPPIQPSHLALLLEIMGQGSRISHLGLVFRSASYLTTLLAKMIHPAPHLHSVRLDTEYSTDSFTIPENFLGKHAPRLVHFEVRGCNIPWRSPVLHNLATLSVGRINLSSASASLEDIAVTLQAATALEVVEISDFLLSHTNVTLPQGMEIELPRLKHLYLSSRGAVLAALLHHMSFPASTTMHLATVDCAEDSLVDYLSSVFSDVSTTPNHPRTVKTLVLDHHDDSTFSLRAWDVGVGRPELSPPHLRCHLGKDQLNDALVPHLLERLSPGLGQLVDLEILHIGLSVFPEEVMAHSFGNCSSLHTIVIQGLCASDIIFSLSHTLPSLSETSVDPTGNLDSKNREPPRNAPALVYPELKTLAISDVNFDGLMSPLIESLRRRTECGSPIGEVDLGCCRHLRRDDVGRLRDEVDTNVVWDGNELGADDSDDSDDPEKFAPYITYAPYGTYAPYLYGDELYAGELDAGDHDSDAEF
ncbi:hypothetical protein AAF712_004506 [Marasmius tenuissimus]|uniref:F-box domain-containing protein n=1 Tax=Marasmius tenuissimus TaxID=585030 RepID=A0ABR3A455_9AGAR